MRIITGSARGVRLRTPEGLNTRPTAERVKEAVFSALQFEIEGRRVLDLFAGSGQMGLEALSRGAQYCVFVDSAASAVEVIRENVAATRMSDRATVLRADAQGYVRRALESGTRFDLIFLDPPYQAGLIPPMLLAAEDLLCDGGAAVCETAQDTLLSDQFGALSRTRRYAYGKTAVHLYRKSLP